MRIEFNKESLDRDNVNLTNIGLFRKYEDVNKDLDCLERTRSCMETNPKKNEKEV